jgi:uncharacterized protein
MVEEMARTSTLLALLACACAPVPEEGAPHPPYWVVEHEGAQSMLVGTMHHEVDARVLPDAVWDALRSARVVSTEADVRAVDPQALLSAVTLADGVSVRDAVSAQDWEAIRRAVAPVLADPEDAEGLQPWFLEGQAVGVRLPEVEQPMDATLVSRAVDAGRTLAFFETWQEQVGLLNALGFDDGLAVLLESARDLDGALAAHAAWADAFSRGDIDDMTALAFDPAAVAERPRYYEEIVARHERWIDTVEEQVQAGDAFIAAGFMHMLTDRGLPALLEARGYAVDRVDARR